MSWQELAYKIDGAETMISFLLLCVSLFFYRLSSTNISLAVWVVANFIMERVAELLLSLAKTDVVLSRQLWYLSFVAVDTLAIIAIYYLHKSWNTKFSKYSVFVCNSLLLLASTQLARFVDRLILESNVLVEFYKYAVLALSMAPMVLMVVILGWSLFSYFVREKRTFS